MKFFVLFVALSVLGTGYCIPQLNGLNLGALSGQQGVPVTLLLATPVQASASHVSSGAHVAAASQQVSGPIHASIHSQHSVQVVDVPNTGSPAQAQSVIIGPNVQPLSLEFHSQSSPLTVTQVHHPGQPAEPQFSKHEEEPDILRQEIVKPVIQEVHETITPFRRITQELKPVQESISQLLSRGEQRQVQAVHGGAGVGSAVGVSTGHSAQLSGQPIALLITGSQQLGGRQLFGGIRRK